MPMFCRERGLHELYADDPERADALVFDRRAGATRRGFLSGSGLATMTAMIGAPIAFAELAHIEDRNALVAELRKRVFSLANPGDIRGGASGLHLREARIAGVRHRDDS